MLIWAHGLWGSPNGSKVTAIRESGIEVNSPDFNNMELEERIDILNELVSKKEVVLGRGGEESQIGTLAICKKFFVKVVLFGAACFDL